MPGAFFYIQISCRPQLESTNDKGTTFIKQVTSNILRKKGNNFGFNLFVLQS